MARSLWVVAVFALLLLALPVAAYNLEVTWTNQEPPAVTTLAATDLTEDGAVLRGQLLDLGASPAVDVNFEWGTTPALGQETVPVRRTLPGEFAATLPGLEADTNYYFRAKAVGNGTAVGLTQSFRTAPPAPVDILPIPWYFLVLAAGALMIAVLLVRRRRAVLYGAVALQEPEEEEPEEDQTIQEVDATLTQIRSLKEGEASTEAEEQLTSALVASVVPVEGRDTRVFPRQIDPTEARRRQAIFQNRVHTMDERLRADATDMDALFAKATYLILQTRHQEALRLLDELTRTDPTYPGAWHLKAKVYEMLGNPKMAELCRTSAKRFG